MDNPKGSTVPMMVACAIVFLIFTFCYVFFFQSDVLAVTQHVLSDGETSYDRTVGAVLITLVLWALQAAVYSLSKLRRRAHALTYLPSFLILAVLTDVSAHTDEHFSFGAWWWLFPLILILWWVVVMMARAMEPYEPNQKSWGLFSRTTAVNLFGMVVMMFLVGIIAQSDENIHRRMRAEVCLSQQDYKDAIEATNTEKADSSLTLLRALALTHEHALAEHFFEVPVCGGSKALRPNGHSVKLLMTTYPRHFTRQEAADLHLVGLLMDKKLDLFAEELPKYYDMKKPLPKHYREALVLYTHRRANPIYIFKSPVIDADYQDYQDMERKNYDPAVRKSQLHDTYGNTYWYYWQYE
ncbi:MAG: DUF6057 family protein [Prevotellaceae bacterium]|nr:DUF6057 family protein [Prevotellaceae bacterium]